MDTNSKLIRIGDEALQEFEIFVRSLLQLDAESERFFPTSSRRSLIQRLSSRYRSLESE